MLKVGEVAWATGTKADGAEMSGGASRKPDNPEVITEKVWRWFHPGGVPGGHALGFLLWMNLMGLLRCWGKAGFRCRLSPNENGAP